MTDGPYTTISVVEYNHIANTITTLRWQKQKAREFLEVGNIADALAILKKEEEP